MPIGRDVFLGKVEKSSAAERTMFRYHDVPFMRTSCTSTLSFAVDRSTKEVSPGILAGGIDIVVFRVFAHLVVNKGLSGSGRHWISTFLLESQRQTNSSDIRGLYRGVVVLERMSVVKNWRSRAGRDNCSSSVSLI